VGMIMTACLAKVSINSANTTGDGLFFGDTTLFKVQMLGLVIVIAFIFVGAFILLKITDLITPLKVSVEDKMMGNDYSQHGENLHPLDFDKRIDFSDVVALNKDNASPAFHFTSSAQKVL
jgi:Amt family ammonium transporter